MVYKNKEVIKFKRMYITGNKDENEIQQYKE